MKKVLALVALVLALAGCSTPQRHTPGAAAPSVAPAAAATTSRSQLPALEPDLTVSGGRVRWDRVGPGWQLVMVVRGVGANGGPAEARLELLAPTGRRTDLAVIDGDAVGGVARSKTSPVPTVEDVSATDRSVLLLFHATARDATAVLLDLVSGAQRRSRVPMGTAGLMLREGGFAYLDARGRLVAVDWDGATRVVSRTTGVVLPSGDRRAVVAAHPLRVLGFDGSVRRLPGRRADGSCNPRGWWDADTALVTCGGALWSAPLAGAPLRLVARAAGEVGVDDAVRTGGSTYVQVLEGCGGAWLARAEADGTTTDLDRTRGRRLLGVVRGRLLVEPATPCSAPTRRGGLALIDPTTGDRDRLLRVGRDEVVTFVRTWGGWPLRVG